MPGSFRNFYRVRHLDNLRLARQHYLRLGKHGAVPSDLIIAMLGQVGDRVNHGGTIVAVLGAVDNVVMFFVTVIVGAIVTALVVYLLKWDAGTGTLSHYNKGRK
jgi:hypothetical protein